MRRRVSPCNNPHEVYHDDGWLNYADWLGYGAGKERRATRSRMREFTSARTWVWGLRLESTVEWFELCSSGDTPEDIPRSAATPRSRGLDRFRDLAAADHANPLATHATTPTGSTATRAG
jgi:hypothetical protein